MENHWERKRFYTSYAGKAGNGGGGGELPQPPLLSPREANPALQTKSPPDVWPYDLFRP